ncbi:MAG: hypothetical protein WB797_18860 [Nocardioides sp.]
MVFIVTLLVVSALGLPVLIVLALRRWGMKEAETERSLLSPQAHTVSYVVPEGEDPALARAALTHAGFVSVLDRTADQRLVVRCEQGERERVRAILEHVDHPTFDGHHEDAAHVQFVDESV